MSAADASGARTRLILGLALAVLVVDQIAKAIVRSELPLHTRRPVVDGYLALTHVHNRGMAFGLFNGIDSPWLRWLLVAVALLAVGIIWSYARRGTHQIGVALGFGAILGGALGNLVDRLRWGYVVDFVLAHWGRHEWPAFNVADAAITMGGVGLFLTLAREGEEPEAEAPAAAPGIDDPGLAADPDPATRADADAATSTSGEPAAGRTHEG